MNKKRQEQLLWWSLVVALLCLAAFVVRVLTVTAAYACELDNEPAPVYKDWRPDISHCMDDDSEVELWDCIRQPGMYRTDI